MAPMPAFAFSGLTRLIKGTKVADLSHEMVSFRLMGEAWIRPG
ncbi:MAG: hypothetical protein R2709_00750 [Marmoricola sp.]